MEKNSLETVRLHGHGFFKTLRQYLTRPCFYFPVVYTDGFVSKCKEDRKGRKPFGILIGGKIICLEDAPDIMTFDQAKEYCKKIRFAGHHASIGCYDLMAKLNRQITDFDKQSSTLGGTPLLNECYWTAELTHDKRDFLVVQMDGINHYGRFVARCECPLRLRPVIDVNDPSTLL